ncbi:oligopeptide ABC transporter permease OppC [uncultured Ezakiella sp.]|uniref:oligopeptide ABC transporter permease OppC n=1 Tax=uncultured Ezakiella sp. TaxID=1637529 RepID=UPI0025F51E09|nr:oligopeptide ABC transporter permease OppC [uncultured Ezakiella sp.]
MNEENLIKQDIELQKIDKDLFQFVEVDDRKSEVIETPEYSYWGSVFKKFFSSKVAIFMLTILILVLAMSFIHPLISGYDHLDQQHINDHSKRFLKPSLENPFGTDSVGRPVFDMVWAGARTSLMISFTTTFITITLGLIVGTIWGFNKKLDFYLMDIYNIISNIPYLLIVILLSYTLGPGVWQLIFALSVTSWFGFAYFMRVQVLIIRDREYNMASRVLGSSTLKIIKNNILPQLISVLVTSIASRLPAYVSTEVFLGFIGLGLSEKEASLGRTIQNHAQYMTSEPYLFLIPVTIIAIISVSLYIVGQTLADASDPRNHEI